MSARLEILTGRPVGSEEQQSASFRPDVEEAIAERYRGRLSPLSSPDDNDEASAGLFRRTVSESQDALVDRDDTSDVALSSSGSHSRSPPPLHARRSPPSAAISPTLKARSSSHSLPPSSLLPASAWFPTTPTTPPRHTPPFTPPPPLCPVPPQPQRLPLLFFPLPHIPSLTKPSTLPHPTVALPPPTRTLSPPPRRLSPADALRLLPPLFFSPPPHLSLPGASVLPPSTSILGPPKMKMRTSTSRRSRLRWRRKLNRARRGGSDSDRASSGRR